jgi:hypothetical protein
MAIADITDNVIYLAMAVRNVGTGLAVLNGWRFHPERLSGPAPAPDPDMFRRLNRDLYIPAGDRGFWQGAFRDPAEPDFALARDAIVAGNVFSIDVLYGDGEGGQRTITRFTVIESRDGNWITAVSHHWNLDRPDPR